MGSLVISLLTLVLLFISGYIVLIVLMQRTSQSGGMGAALGGGAAESAFGSETNNILMKGTVYGIVAFFVVSLGLYLIYQSAHADRDPTGTMETLIAPGVSGDASVAAERLEVDGTSVVPVESMQGAGEEAAAEDSSPTTE